MERMKEPVLECATAAEFARWLARFSRSQRREEPRCGPFRARTTRSGASGGAFPPCRAAPETRRRWGCGLPRRRHGLCPRRTASTLESMLVERWVLGLGAGVVLVALGACGGNVTTGPGSGGSGATLTGGNSSTGGSGGTTATCTDTQDCCQKACNLVSTQLQCSSGLPDCSCPMSGLPTGCSSALRDLYRCVLTAGASSFACDSNGQPALRCGVCDSEMNAVAQACGGSAIPCAP